MSPLTLFLAKLWGLYCIVVALALAARKQDTLRIVDAFLRNPSLKLLGGLIALVIGLAMVIGHNLWSGGPLPVVVTLLGWASLLKGAVFLFASPERSKNVYSLLGYEKYFRLYMAATLMLGLYLTIAAFCA